MTKLVVEIFDDGAISWTRPATQAEIDAAISDKLRRYVAIGEAAEALMFANGGFKAWYSRDGTSIRVYHNEVMLGTGNDLAEALKAALAACPPKESNDQS